MKQLALPSMSMLARRKPERLARAGKEAMPEIQGQPAALITAQLKMRHGTIEVAARKLGEDARRISETITRGGSTHGRRNERCRVKLCLDLNLAYAALWGGEPNWNIVSPKVRAEYEARFTAAAETRERVEAAA